MNWKIVPVVTKQKSKPVAKKTLTLEEKIAERMNLGGVTKIAYLAVSELVNQGRADFLFLREPDVSDWYTKMKTKEQTVRELIADEERKEQVKKNALAKLTAEEKKLLGI
ncbi:MAG: hypothetical protein EB127_12345 [Alphaproteobacteria bacterium]|nr:hypothetical protein [Alphaproteobacteria bacterium]